MSESPARDPWQEYDRLKAMWWNASLEIVSIVDQARAEVEEQHQAALAAKDAEIAKFDAGWQQAENDLALAQAELPQARSQLQQVTQERDALRSENARQRGQAEEEVADDRP